LVKISKYKEIIDMYFYQATKVQDEIIIDKEEVVKEFTIRY